MNDTKHSIANHDSASQEYAMLILMLGGVAGYDGEYDTSEYDVNEYDAKGGIGVYENRVVHVDNKHPGGNVRILFNNGVDKIYADFATETLLIMLGHDNSPLAQTLNQFYKMYPKEGDRVVLYLANSALAERKYAKPNCKNPTIGCIGCREIFSIEAFIGHECIDHCRDCGVLITKKNPYHNCDMRTINVSLQISSVRSVSSEKYNINPFTYKHLSMVSGFIKDRVGEGSCVVCMEDVDMKNPLVTLNGCKCKSATICESCFVSSMKAKIMSNNTNGVYKCSTCGIELSR